MNWKDAKKELIANDPNLIEELENNKVEYDIKRQILIARKAQKLSQADLARKVNTRQSNISRLENGSYNPSVEFLERVAKALGKKLEINFV